MSVLKFVKNDSFFAFPEPITKNQECKVQINLVHLIKWTMQVFACLDN